MLRISVLGSGSGGNSAVVFTENTRLLVDAGLSAKQLHLRLAQVGVAAESLDAILVTHEHGDHVRGLDVFCKTVDVPIYTNAMTREVLVSSILTEPKSWKLVRTGGAFSIGDIETRTFQVAHDATEPMGFVFSDGDSSIGVISDVGYVTNLMRDHLRAVNLLFVEANYDEMMLQNDTKRPWPTKQRIISRHGHLSNTQTASFLCDIAGPHLRRVILGHLSQDCNEAKLAASVMTEKLAEAGWNHVDIVVAAQAEPTECFAAGVWETMPISRVEEPEVEYQISFRETLRTAVGFQQAELF